MTLAVRTETRLTDSCVSLPSTYRHGSGQLKIMFIGGPNQRKDYHIEEGEEVRRSVCTSGLGQLMGCG